MKRLINIINEDFKLKKKGKIAHSEYKYNPKNKKELISLLEQLLDKRGKDADLNDIDTSAITDMSELFEDLDPRNIDISGWDVSNVENMAFMFYDCHKFNSDLSTWDVGKVNNMSNMFTGCTSLINKPSWYKK